MSVTGVGRPSFTSGMPHVSHHHGGMSSGGGHGHLPGGSQPVSMKLFATWEVERTPPNCIPRLCSLTIARLSIFNNLDPDLSSILIAVKMQSSKRTLRSNEISLPPTGLLDTELDLAFSLQYPHFLKREGNTLQIMLQRRKKYKNRTILGYKTLAVGIINMSHVLQRQMDLELELVEGKNGNGSVLGKVYLLSLSSQPVDHEEDLAKQVGDNDRGLECDSEEEEEFTSGDEGSDSEPMLVDSIRGNSGRRKSNKGLSNSAARQRNIKQKFVALLRRFKVTEPEDLKGAFRGNTEQNSQVNDIDPEEIEDLLNELEDYSDYGPDMDSASVGSTPKPSLRPFFSSSRSLIRDTLDKNSYSIMEKPEIVSDHLSDDSSKGAMSDSHPETLTDPEHSDQAGMASSPPQSGDEMKPGGKERNGKENSDRRSKVLVYKTGGQQVLDRLSKSIKTRQGDVDKREGAHGYSAKDKLERLNSGNNLDSSSPRKVLIEQLHRVLPSDDSLPDQIILANTGDPQASHVASKLSETGVKVICTAGPADVRATLTCLVTRLQKYCNTNIAPPSVMRVGLCGSDSFLNSMLRPYVELLSGKPPDWQSHILFYIIPLGTNTVSKALAARCQIYSRLFHDDSWRDLLEKPEPTKSEIAELVGRVSQYMSMSCTSQLNIAEAMVTYQDKVTDEDTCQVFVPFLSDVRLGTFTEQESNDFDLNLNSSFGHNSSLLKCERNSSPPSSPNISKHHTFDKDFFQKQKEEEYMELQLDYFVVNSNEIKNDKIFGTKNEAGEKENSKKQDSEKSKKQTDLKSSIKTHFKNLSISHLSNSQSYSPSDSTHIFSMSYTTKEKKPKAVLKIGKKKDKPGDIDSKFHNIEGINRLICMSKSNYPLAISIDGQEWCGVKFFQVSAQWQTHIKTLPVCVGEI